MNYPIQNPTSQVTKPKCRIKRYQICFLVASVVFGAFITYLADYADRQTLTVGLSVLGTLTLFTSLAAFFKAFVKD